MTHLAMVNSLLTFGGGKWTYKSLGRLGSIFFQRPFYKEVNSTVFMGYTEGLPTKAVIEGYTESLKHPSMAAFVSILFF